MQKKEGEKRDRKKKTLTAPDWNCNNCKRLRGADYFHPQMECRALCHSDHLHVPLSPSLTHATWHRRRGEGVFVCERLGGGGVAGGGGALHAPRGVPRI